MNDLNVLVLEDEPFQRLVAVTALKKVVPGSILEAADGKEAVAILESCGHVDIAICDLQMSGMDGLAFLRHASLSGKVHSVILSSEVDPILRQATISMIECLGLNFLGDLGKPFSLERITALLTRYNARRQDLPRQIEVAELPSVADVVRGLDNGEFEAYYQPKVALDGGGLIGAEVLARWNHPHLGVLPPSHFLYVMETYNLVDKLFWQLFSQGLATRRKLAQLGQPINLAFNVHPSQLGSRALAENISALLTEFHLPPSSVMFEITETGLISAPASSLENLVRLRIMGCGLAMDDFGAGYSSLDRLCEFPFSQIKLDRTFVQKMKTQPRSCAVISSVVALAQALGISLVVEGVESDEQRVRLIELGCSIAQGYLFAVEAHPSLTLFSQLRIEHEDMAIAEDDWAWLRHKGHLRLGAALDETSPFNVRLDDENYEGITADVATLVGQLLGMRIKVVSFDTHADAVAALAAGKIDLLGSHYSSAGDSSLVLSQPYARDRLAVFKRMGEKRNSPEDLAGLSVAVAREHVGELRQRFPRARFVVFGSHDEAVAAVAFGHTDLYLDDVLSAYHRINRSYYGYVRFERFADARLEGGYGFLLRRGDTNLLRVVNSAIGAINQDRLESIARRWVGSGSLPTGQRIALTPQESRWIARHPVVRLVINDDLAPLAFFNSDETFSGIASDLLDMISRRTGLHFQVTPRSGGFPEQIGVLARKEADLAIMSRSSKREEMLRFTRSFLSTSYVLVTRADDKGRAESPGSLDGKRIAIPAGHVGMQQVRERYPQATMVEVGVALDAMNLVYEGRADAAVVPLVTARYYIVRLFRERLAIADLVPIGAATAHFAVRRGDAELQSILDKALLSISPDDLSDIVNRWRSPPGMSGQTWVDYILVITEILAIAAALLLLCLGWVTYQRRQIRVRARVEQALSDQLRFVEALTDCMPPPLYVRDVNGRMLSCNRSYLQSVGLSSEEVMNRTVLELPMENFETAPEFHRSYLMAMREGRTIEAVYPVALGGRERWIDHWIQPFRDSSGTIRGVICGWLDITEHRQLIDELEEAKNLADEASRAKTTFLATMSHEIRTPMNAVIGILELALKRAETGRVDRSSIEIAYASAKSLLELIGDILDIARIESGRLSLSPKRANLRELVESVARVFEGLARQKRLSLVLEIDSSINGDVLLDAMRFKQILSNLVSNAIKFTDEGSIRIRIDGRQVEPSLLQVNLCVEDTGIGISLGDQQQLFRPFAQVNRNLQNTEGTGLGLVISRSLCEMMGGRLVMSSELGQGTRIDVELRLQVLEPIVENVRAIPLGSRQARRLQVLVVDDHAVNRQILHQQLSFLGHDVEEAENGLSALNLWHGQPFDMVITDCHMPLMSGSDLARSIRQEERENGEEPVVIIGLTADAQPEEIERCIQAGMNECLIKPIGLDVLEERLLALGFAADELPVTIDAEPVAIPTAPRLYDLDSLHALTGGEPTMLRRLLDELLTSNRKDLETLEGLVQRQETGELAELAHRIKGAARVVRGEQLVESCRRLEDACLSPNASFAWVEECAVGVKLAILALDESLVEECTD